MKAIRIELSESTAWTIIAVVFLCCFFGSIGYGCNQSAHIEREAIKAGLEQQKPFPNSTAIWTKPERDEDDE